MRGRLASAATAGGAKLLQKSTSKASHKWSSFGLNIFRHFSGSQLPIDEPSTRSDSAPEAFSTIGDDKPFGFLSDTGFSDNFSVPESHFELDGVTDAISSSAEIIAAASTLSNSPPHMVIKIIDYIHLAADIPYWETIVVSTIALRVCLFPVAIYTVKAASRMAHAKPKINALQAEFTNHPNMSDPALQQEFQRKMSQLLQREKVNPVRSIIFPLIQIPMFISVFFGLRQIGEYLPGIATGGTLWFTDLSATDAFFIFPVLNAMSFLVMIEIGMDGLPPNPDMERFKIFLRMFALGLIPLTSVMPQSVFVYWATNNSISIMQTLVLKNKSFRSYLEIPDPPKPDPNEPAPTSFAGFNFKEAWDKNERDIIAAREASRKAAAKRKTIDITANPPKAQTEMDPSSDRVDARSNDPIRFSSTDDDQKSGNSQLRK